MCDVFFDRAANKIKCMKSTRTLPSFTDSFHFGCKKVVLAGNETKPVDYGSGQHDKFKGKKAADFFVTYADYVQLPAGADFDEDSCKGCFGKDTSTGLGPPEPLGIMGDWFLPQLPFDDPYIVYQPIGGAPFTPEYRSIHLPLGTPSNFPVDVPQLPRNVPERVPDSYSAPLNLFDIYTMGPDSPPTQASLPVDTAPPAPGVFETDPAEFDASGQPVVFTIPGGEQPFGSVTIHRAPTTTASTAAAPDLPEGASVELRVTVHEPDTPTETGDALFAESGTFVRDTQPPEVVSNRVGLDSATLLHVEVEARDETTAPLGASLWFSVDNGLNWKEVALQPLSDLFVDEKTRTFAGQAGPFDSGTRGIRYFFMSQDEVFNYNSSEWDGSAT